jgi:hypothetical protein
LSGNLLIGAATFVRRFPSGRVSFRRNVAPVPCDVVKPIGRSGGNKRVIVDNTKEGNILRPGDTEGGKKFPNEDKKRSRLLALTSIVTGIPLVSILQAFGI